MRIANTRAFMRALSILAGTWLIALIGAGPAQAEPTDVAIHVRAVDAKFIGTGVGGINVTVEDASTGALLDSGRIEGGTGDTNGLMKKGQTRGEAPVTDGTAGYRATLDIDRPTRLRIRATGPLAVADSIQTVTATTWVVPGHDMVDPGIQLSMPGLLVELVERRREGDAIHVVADVSMMCGCPITDGGLWDAAEFQVMAQLYREDEKVAERQLSFTGETNRFSGRLNAPGTGDYRLVVYAFQDSRDNTGVVSESLSLR